MCVRIPTMGTCSWWCSIAMNPMVMFLFLRCFFWGSFRECLSSSYKTLYTLEHFDIDTPKNYPTISVYERSVRNVNLAFSNSLYMQHIWHVQFSACSPVNSPVAQWGQDLICSQRGKNAVDRRKRPFHLMTFNKNISLSPDFRILSWIWPNYKISPT